jgi:hypothetical protein
VPRASNRAAALNPRVTEVRQGRTEEIEVNKLIENVDKDLESQKAYPFQEGLTMHKKARRFRLLDTYKEDARNKHIIKLVLNRVRRSSQKTDRTKTLEEFFELLLELESENNLSLSNRASADPHDIGTENKSISLGKRAGRRNKMEKVMTS